jgi:hypothetical protein
MAKHDGSKSGSPSTGDGRTSKAKPAKSQITMKTKTGATLWGQTAKLFGSKKK